MKGDAERGHDLLPRHRWLKIADRVFFLDVFELLDHDVVVAEVTLDFGFVFRSDVCPAQHHQVVNVVARLEKQPTNGAVCDDILGGAMGRK